MKHLPKPSERENQDDFIARYMGDVEAGEVYPDEKNRAIAAFKTYRGNDASEDEIKELMMKILSSPARPLKNARGQIGRPLPIKFIEPGLVHYADVGTVLVTKGVLDKMLPSLTGRPIFNETHREVANDDFSSGRGNGIAQDDGRFNPEDAWYEVTGLFWDEDTLENIKQHGYTVSCAYDVTRWGPGGVHNNIPYDREVLAGEYTHLAIVDNPRYERAKIIYNQGGRMKLKFWNKDKKTEDAPSEVELTNSKLEIGGKEVGLDDVVKGYQAEEKRKADELANSTRKFDDGDMIDVDGKKVSIKELKAGFAASLKNADDDKDKKDKKKDDDDKERKNAEAKEKEEKEAKEKERENARKNEEEHEKGDHKDKPMENCLTCEAEKRRSNSQHFDDLKNAANRRDGKFEEPSLSSVQDKVAKGNERYGVK